MTDKGKELLDLLGGVLILFPWFFQILFSFFRVEIVRRLINQLYTQIKLCCGEGNAITTYYENDATQRTVCDNRK